MVKKGLASYGVHNSCPSWLDVLNISICENQPSKCEATTAFCTTGRTLKHHAIRFVCFVQEGFTDFSLLATHLFKKVTF